MNNKGKKIYIGCNKFSICTGHKGLHCISIRVNYGINDYNVHFRCHYNKIKETVICKPISEIQYFMIRSYFTK
jgi:hypothetical protein